MSAFEKYRTTLTTVNLLMSANCCRHAFDYQQSEIDQLKAEKAELEKRMHKAISKWVAITSIVTTQRNGLPDEFYQKLDQLHDVLTGFDEALRGEHE